MTLIYEDDKNEIEEDFRGGDKYNEVCVEDDDETDF